ncbi:WhiB family transcriptional regulator [Sanguibacter sp. 4.1]|uniref:WhiB family transcriptional regulator n=1 Tax=Sanguibacter biliveldensis TaxID=3030830 RepID=A0AAF1C2L2_9MICO|nr:WhiB family transcriptional regulator [Sanguibacter sp. 4.1]WPF81874.1 WhiB family transcriptional regulator [Sanguibacter sp. 4.1]
MDTPTLTRPETTPTARTAPPETTSHETAPRATLRRLELDWVDDAACDGADPALFDPVNRHVAARATAVCAACPVRRACLLDALEDEEDTAYGPWLVRGGMTPKERRDLRGPSRAALVDELRDSLAPVPVR